jgi:hypothetical protein
MASRTAAFTGRCVSSRAATDPCRRCGCCRAASAAASAAAGCSESPTGHGTAVAPVSGAPALTRKPTLLRPLARGPRWLWAGALPPVPGPPEPADDWAGRAWHGPRAAGRRALPAEEMPLRDSETGEGRHNGRARPCTLAHGQLPPALSMLDRCLEPAIVLLPSTVASCRGPGLLSRSSVEARLCYARSAVTAQCQMTLRRLLQCQWHAHCS